MRLVTLEEAVSIVERGIATRAVSDETREAFAAIVRELRKKRRLAVPVEEPKK